MPKKYFIQIGEGNQFNEVGKYGPYSTKEKFGRYKEVAEQLVKDGKAFRCFCDVEKLSLANSLVYKVNKIPTYDGTCINLSQQEIQDKLDKKIPYGIRLKCDTYKRIPYKDNVQKEQFIYEGFLSNQVIIKTGGLPTKFFIYAIDDMDQNISHVFRQVEWMKDLPKQKLIYDLFDNKNFPEFFHLSNMTDFRGHTYDGRQLHELFRLKFLVQKGFSIEAIANFVVTQIWMNNIVRNQIQEKLNSKNKTDKYLCEIYTPEYLESNFTAEDIMIRSTPFDQEKLDFFNRHYIRQKYLPLFTDKLSEQKSDELIQDFRSQVVLYLGDTYLESVAKMKDSDIVQVIEIVTNRIRYWSDLTSYNFFFSDPNYQKKQKSKDIVFSDPETNVKFVQIIKDMINIFNKKIPDNQFNDTTITRSIFHYNENVNTKIDKDVLFKFLRFTFTGYHQSHAVGLTCQIIGKAACLRRLRSMAQLVNEIVKEE